MHYSLSADHTLATIPLGVDPSCSEVALENETVDLEGYLGLPIAGSTLLLHVGSTIPRKRMDTLLRVFARTREDWPSVRLVQAGGTLTVQQAALAEELGVLPYISQMPFLPRPVLAALYRNCAAVLQTSSHEGFGLPVAEAMACGAVVIASDIPVLREVGGESVVFCPVADVGAWSGAVNSILHERESSLHRYQARRLAASQHATRFSWSAVADTVGDIYTDLHAFAREK